MTKRLYVWIYIDDIDVTHALCFALIKIGADSDLTDCLDLLKSDENDEEGGDSLSSKMKKTFKASFKLDSSDGVFKFDKLQIEQVRRRESGHRHLDGH